MDDLAHFFGIHGAQSRRPFLAQRPPSHSLIPHAVGPLEPHRACGPPHALNLPSTFIIYSHQEYCRAREILLSNHDGRRDRRGSWHIRLMAHGI